MCTVKINQSGYIKLKSKFILRSLKNCLSTYFWGYIKYTYTYVHCRSWCEMNVSVYANMNQIWSNTVNRSVILLCTQIIPIYMSVVCSSYRNYYDACLYSWIFYYKFSWSSFSHVKILNYFKVKINFCIYQSLTWLRSIDLLPLILIVQIWQYKIII